MTPCTGTCVLVPRVRSVAKVYDKLRLNISIKLCSYALVVSFESIDRRARYPVDGFGSFEFADHRAR